MESDPTMNPDEENSNDIPNEETHPIIILDPEQEELGNENVVLIRISAGTDEINN